MAFEFIRSAEKLGKIANQIDGAEAIGLDLETTGKSPYSGKSRLCSLNTGQGIYVIDLWQTGGLGPVADAIRHSKDTVVVGQTLKFDQKFLLFDHDLELGRVFDTHRASAMLYNGKEGMGHDLYAIYDRELHLPPGPELGGSDWSGTLSREQIEYSAEDVTHLLDLRNVLKPKVLKAGLAVACTIEFGAILPEAAIELNGFRLDADKWMELADYNRKEAKRLEAELWADLPRPDSQLALPGIDPGFNLGSRDKILASFHKMGVKIQDTQKTTLAMVAGKYPIIKKFIEWRTAAKRLSSFGPKYLAHIDPLTGRVHCDYWPLTGAGRYSCSAPWTPVRTRRGVVPIVEVKVGDLVWTHKGRWRRVLSLLPQGKQQTYEVRFSTGDVLTCTSDHRLLASAGKWVRISEYIEDLGSGRKEPEGCSGVVPQHGTSCGRHSRKAGNYVSQRTSCYSSVLARGRAQGAGRAALLCFEAEFAESDVGQVRRAASQLEGGVRGRSRLLDLSLERGARVCSPRSHDGSSGGGESSCFHGCSPYRSRQEEQRPRQLSAVDEDSASRAALYAGEGQSVVTIEEIHTGPSIEVYDLTVEEDESFETCGVFSHNCSDPNLQQIPRDKQFRRCFTPGAGRRLVLADYSQIELRLVAEASKDPTLCEIYLRGEDAHTRTASLVSQVPIDQVTKGQRQMAKPINFGLCLAAGQRVLTHVGLVPIEAVKDWHLVWDGIEWVSHDGLLFKGYAPVVTYDGLSGTYGHEVYTQDGRKVRLGELASSICSGRLAVGAVGTFPIRYSEFDRGCGAERAQSQVRGGQVLYMLKDSLAAGGQHQGQENDWVLLPEKREVRERLSSGCSWTALRRNDSTMRARQPRFIAPLQRARYQGAIQVSGALHSVGFGEVSRSQFRRVGIRSKEQQWILLAGQPEASDSGSEREERQALGAVVPVYDLLNAGPRHRFTVEGKIVSNCYGMMPEKLVLYAMTNYGVALTISQAEKFHRLYFEGYPGVKGWQNRMIRDGKRTGISRTNSGRLRYLDPEKTYNEWLNTPIQGSGADGLKASMAVVYQRLRQYGRQYPLRACMDEHRRVFLVHMVHDELITDVDDDADLCLAVQHDIEQGMVDGMTPLMKHVPVVAEGSSGLSWADKA